MSSTVQASSLIDVNPDVVAYIGARGWSSKELTTDSFIAEVMEERGVLVLWSEPHPDDDELRVIRGVPEQTVPLADYMNTMSRLWELERDVSDMRETLRTVAGCFHAAGEVQRTI